MAARATLPLPHQIFHPHQMETAGDMTHGNGVTFFELSFSYSSSDSNYQEYSPQGNSWPPSQFNIPHVGFNQSGPPLMDLNLTQAHQAPQPYLATATATGTGSHIDFRLKAQVFYVQSGCALPHLNETSMFPLLNSDPYAIYKSSVMTPSMAIPLRRFSRPPLGLSGPLFPDPFGAGPSNWADPSPIPPGMMPVSTPSPSPSLAVSFPTHTSSDSGYQDDSSAEGFTFSNVSHHSPEADIENVFGDHIASSNRVVPMDCSPPISLCSSPASSPASSSATPSDRRLSDKSKGKNL